MVISTSFEQIADILSDNALLKTALSRYGVTEEDLRERKEASLQKLGKNGQFLWDVLCAMDNPKVFSPETFSQYPVAMILDYLQKTHAYYLNQRLGEIELSLMHLQKKYSDSEDALYWEMIYLLFSAWKRHLYLHIDQEENTLFPYITKLLEAKQQQKPVSDTYRLSQFVHQHEDDQVEDGLKEICQSIRKHQLVDGPIPLSLKVLLTQLDVFERDLWVHGLIEDNVLLPRVEKIEEEVRG